MRDYFRTCAFVASMMVSGPSAAGVIDYGLFQVSTDDSNTVAYTVDQQFDFTTGALLRIDLTLSQAVLENGVEGGFNQASRSFRGLLELDAGLRFSRTDFALLGGNWNTAFGGWAAYTVDFSLDSAGFASTLYRDATWTPDPDGGTLGYLHDLANHGGIDPFHAPPWVDGSTLAPLTAWDVALSDTVTAAGGFTTIGSAFLRVTGYVESAPVPEPGGTAILAVLLGAWILVCNRQAAGGMPDGKAIPTPGPVSCGTLPVRPARAPAVPRSSVPARSRGAGRE